VHLRRDEKIERLVASWPGALNTDRTRSLGFSGDTNFADIVRAYAAESQQQKRS